MKPLPNQFTLQTIKGGHAYPIDALDISPIQRIIVTISTVDNSVAFYTLVDGSMNDFVTTELRQKKAADNHLDQELNYLNVINTQTLYGGRLRWTCSYKAKISKELPLMSVSMSPLGDFCVFGGRQFVSIW